MGIDVINKDGIKVSEVNAAEALTGEVNEALFYEVVKMQMANRRAGTASTKTKGEVSGGGAKPWKQKGTGRARSGSNRSPVWRHGGTVFGPHPRDYSYKLPKKVMRSALKSAIALKIKDGAIKVFNDLDLSEPKTKVALEVFTNAGLRNALVVIEAENKNLQLAVRNLRDFKVVTTSGINVYDILNYDGLVMTRGAFEKVGAMVQ